MIVIKEPYTIKLHDTDAAGILFFANQFKMVHDIYERFLAQIGFGFGDRFARRDFFIPIVHAEADFMRPLRVGDTIEIALTVAKIGQTSFSLKYRLTDGEGRAAGTAETVHVTIDPDSGQKIDLPGLFRAKLEEMAQLGG